jgi:hypothetical protein
MNMEIDELLLFSFRRRGIDGMVLVFSPMSFVIQHCSAEALISGQDNETQ